MRNKLPLLVVLGWLIAAAPVAMAQPASQEDRLLERTAMPDTTPQQRYQTAIREAGGGYKEYLATCAAMAAAERASCRREAKATYDRDMAEARQIIRRGKQGG